MTAQQPKIALIYDHECPVCDAYCKYLALKKLDADIEIISARSDHPAVGEARQQGFDLDEGFVLRIGTDYFHGAEAIHKLALLSTGNSYFNKVNYFIFRSRKLSRVLYPLLRSGRNMLLFILGKQRISAQS